MPNEPGTAKTCVVCGQDCSGKPRVKDPQGRYSCKSCHEAVLAKTTPSRAPVVRTATLGQRSPPAPSPEPDPVFDGLDNAAVLEGLESAGSAGPGALEPCPRCGAMTGSGSLVCMSCGFNRQTGRAARTSVSKAPRERRAPRIPMSLGPGMVFVICLAGFGGMAAATMANPALFLLFLVVYLLFSLVATIMMVACPFMDGDNGWGIIAIVSLLVPIVGLLMLYYVFFVSDRGHLEAVLGSALIASFLILFLALNLDPEFLRDAGP
ncbi:MAG: hypothetical protein ACKVU4_05480 [Phycisphaerales bacterium]